MLLHGGGERSFLSDWRSHPPPQIVSPPSALGVGIVHRVGVQVELSLNLAELAILRDEVFVRRRFTVHTHLKEMRGELATGIAEPVHHRFSSFFRFLWRFYH